MQNNYIPKFSNDEFGFLLSSYFIRKDKNGVGKIGIKDLEGNTKEEDLEKIINANSYNGKTIIRVYSSGHVFFSNDQKKVFLTTTEKNGKIFHQFTGGSPLEEENIKIFLKEKGKYRVDFEKVNKNAKLRTKNRTGVTILEEYNEKPLIDCVLLEQNENGKNFYKLVYLFHFVVKKYDGILGFTGKENTIDGKMYNIEDLPATQYVAPNVFIICKKAQEILKN